MKETLFLPNVKFLSKKLLLTVLFNLYYQRFKIDVNILSIVKKIYIALQFKIGILSNIDIFVKFILHTRMICLQ